MEQTLLATIPGTIYTLSFDLGSSSIFSTPSGIQTTISGPGVLGGPLTSPFMSTSTGTNNWETFTTTFTGTGGSATIRLVGSFAAGDYVGLDKVSVVATPIPEPGAMALMLAGLAVVGSVASRRRIQR